MKEVNIVTAQLDEEVEFDGHKIKTIKFDLEHINRGCDAEKHDYKSARRSSYTAEDIVELFEQFGYYSIEWEEGRNKFKIEIRGKWRTRYFAFVHDHATESQKKIVVDIPEDFKHEGVIITVY